MVLQDLLAGGVEYVQDSQPSNADAGEIWLDTSVDPSALKIYDASSDVWDEAQASNLDAPVSNIQDEIQSGRTRELLLLLQDKPVPEVVDPLNIQSGLSEGYKTDGNGDYQLSNQKTSTATRPDDNTQEGNQTSKQGLHIKVTSEVSEITGYVSSNTESGLRAYLEDASDNTTIESKDISEGSVTFSGQFSSGEYYIILDNTDSFYTIGILDSYSYPYESEYVDIIGSFDSSESNQGPRGYKSVEVGIPTELTGHVTDRFDAPTTAPADFKQWESVRAEDVTIGGSTSANPVEFEILDSSDTVLTSSRIPKSEIADEPFALRDREYSEDAGSDGQSTYTIPQTGTGGHYGIPILSVVTVEQNGSVLDPSNWEFDGVDTVTIDTSAVSISSGDTITISYDFDVFDSTLQPRAYLNRESTSETSPSISHFRYEYVI